MKVSEATAHARSGLGGTAPYELSIGVSYMYDVIWIMNAINSMTTTVPWTWTRTV